MPSEETNPLEDANPLTAEIIYAGKGLLAEDRREATMERMGGKNSVEEVVVRMRNAIVMRYPGLVMFLGEDGLAAVESAIFTGMVAGVACEQRARKNEELMGHWGLE